MSEKSSGFRIGVRNDGKCLTQRRGAHRERPWSFLILRTLSLVRSSAALSKRFTTGPRTSSHMPPGQQTRQGQGPLQPRRKATSCSARPQEQLLTFFPYCPGLTLISDVAKTCTNSPGVTIRVIWNSRKGKCFVLPVTRKSA